MAQKYTCPVCGASHKELQDQCRLCGQALGPEAAVGVPQAARVEVAERRGIGAIVGVVVLLVIAIVVVAVLLGAVPGLKSIDAAKSKAGLSSTADGWSRFDYPEGGFSVEFPEGERKTDSPSDSYNAYAFIGKDTLLLVTATPIMTQQEFDQLTQTTEGNTLKKKVQSEADDIEKTLKANGVKVDKRTDSSAYGVPAVYFETRDAKPIQTGLRGDAPLFSKDMVFITNGVRYTVTVVSVYREVSQFDRLLASLVINGRPGTAAPTTTAAP